MLKDLRVLSNDPPGLPQPTADFAASGEGGLQPVAYRHQFIDLGDDAVLLGEGWERDWISSHHRHVPSATVGDTGG